MAFTKKPMEWKATGTFPSQAFIDNGFKPLDRPPAAWFNKQWSTTFDAITEIQAKAGEIKTINGQLPDSSGNITIQTGGGTASSVSIVDSGGYYTSDNVEGALQEVGQTMNTIRGSLYSSAVSLLGA